jgi:hypothetical protein
MKKVVFVLLLLSLSSPGLMAQNTMNFDDYMQLARSDIRSAVKEIIIANMAFTEQESAAFWPVYAEYEKEQITINDRLLNLIKEYATAYNAGNVPDKTAEGLLQRSLKVQKDTMGLQEKFTPKFKNVLPITKVVRFFQIQNKLQAIINLQLAAEIPLVK